MRQKINLSAVLEVTITAEFDFDIVGGLMVYPENATGKEIQVEFLSKGATDMKWRLVRAEGTSVSFIWKEEGEEKFSSLELQLLQAGWFLPWFFYRWETKGKSCLERLEILSKLNVRWRKWKFGEDFEDSENLRDYLVGKYSYQTRYGENCF